MGDMVVPALVCGLDTWPVVRRQVTLPSQCLSHPGVEMDAGFLSPGENFGSVFAGFVLLAAQNLYPIIVYSLANYGPLNHPW